MENEELELIKKLYGENLMHLCRTLFPTLLNTPQHLYSILESTFAPTRSLIQDIKDNNLEQEFKNFILNFIDERKNYVDSNKKPFELLEKAGYTLYECKSESDIQSFKKYYSEGEIICTITKRNRLKRCFVFFAVKNDIDKIKREDFDNPKRDDRYGTSVISIQFDRGRVNTVSIKNRYNHTVDDPDATFDNNLENIIPGLTKSFEKYYGLNIVNKIDDISFIEQLPYVKSLNNKYYRWNCIFDNVYYCENNIIIDHGILIDKFAKNKERYILMDYYVLDRKEKKMFLYDEFIEDSFIDSITSLGKIKDTFVIKKGEMKLITILFENNKKCEIKLDSKNRIISYINNYVYNILDNFMYYYNNLEYLELNNVSKISYNFLAMNSKLKDLYLPRVKEIGDSFMAAISRLKHLYLPDVEIIGNDFLKTNIDLEEIYGPKLENVGSAFLIYNINLKSLDFPRLLKTGECFLMNNSKIEKINLSKDILVGEYSLTNIDLNKYISNSIK